MKTFIRCINWLLRHGWGLLTSMRLGFQSVVSIIAVLAFCCLSEGTKLQWEHVYFLRIDFSMSMQLKLGSSRSSSINYAR
jgi:hypothetical protein